MGTGSGERLDITAAGDIKLSRAGPPPRVSFIMIQGPGDTASWLRERALSHSREAPKRAAWPSAEFGSGHCKFDCYAHGRSHSCRRRRSNVQLLG